MLKKIDIVPKGWDIIGTKVRAIDRRPCSSYQIGDIGVIYKNNSSSERIGVEINGHSVDSA